jgi:hypothetical protein
MEQRGIIRPTYAVPTTCGFTLKRLTIAKIALSASVSQEDGEGGPCQPNVVDPFVPDSSYGGPPPPVQLPPPQWLEQVSTDLLDPNGNPYTLTSLQYEGTGCSQAGGLNNSSTGCGYQPFSSGTSSIPTWYLEEAGLGTWSYTMNLQGPQPTPTFNYTPPVDNNFFSPTNPNPFLVPQPPPSLHCVPTIKTKVGSRIVTSNYCSFTY